MDFIAKVGSTLERVRTPLTLGGLAVLVLYGVYGKILDMDIFGDLTEESTAVVIDRIALYVFVLAIVAVVLGAASYMFSKHRENSGDEV
jgi:hypothetical protein